MSFGDHLGPNQQVEFALVQRVKSALEIVVPPNSVTIQAPYAGLRKQTMQQFFQLLRASPEKLHVFAAALAADPRHRRHEAAVMADHAMRALMVGHGDSTVS